MKNINVKTIAEVTDPKLVEEAKAEGLKMSAQDLSENTDKWKLEFKEGIDKLEEPKVEFEGEVKDKIVLANSSRLGLLKVKFKRECDDIHEYLSAQQDWLEHGAGMATIPTGNLGLIQQQAGQAPQVLPPPDVLDLIARGNPHFEGKTKEEIVKAYFNEPHKILNDRFEHPEDFSAARALFPSNMILMATETADNPGDYRVMPGIAPSKDRTSRRFIDRLVILPSTQSVVRHRQFAANPYDDPGIYAEAALATSTDIETSLVESNLERFVVTTAVTDQVQGDIPGAMMEFMTVYNSALAGKLDDAFLVWQHQPGCDRR